MMPSYMYMCLIKAELEMTPSYMCMCLIKAEL